MPVDLCLHACCSESADVLRRDGNDEKENGSVDDVETACRESWGDDRMGDGLERNAEARRLKSRQTDLKLQFTRGYQLSARPKVKAKTLTQAI